MKEPESGKIRFWWFVVDYLEDGNKSEWFFETEGDQLRFMRYWAHERTLNYVTDNDDVDCIVSKLDNGDLEGALAELSQVMDEEYDHGSGNLKIYGRTGLIAMGEAVES